MNKIGKSVVFIIAILSIAVFVVSLTGVTTKYGDITTILINGREQVKKGFGFNTQARMIFKADESTTEQQLKEAADIVSKRMATYTAVSEYQVITGTESKTIEVVIPWSENDGYALLYELQSLIPANNLFTVREGELVDDSGRPTGKTLDNILLTNDDISSIIASTDTTGLYGMAIYFKDASKVAFDSKLTELYNADDTSRVSFWIDDTMIYSQSAAKLLTASTDYVGVSSSRLNSSNSVTYANTLMLGTIEIELANGITVYDENSGIGANGITALILACIISMGAIFLVMLIKRGLFGLCGIISVLATMGTMIFVLTGFIGGLESQFLTAASAAAFIVVLVVSAVMTAREGDDILSGIADGHSRAKSISDAFSSSRVRSIKIFISMFVLGVFCTVICSRNGSILSGLFSKMVPAFETMSLVTLKYFGILVITASIGGIIFMLIAKRLMFKSLSSFDSINDKIMLGGSNK